MKISELQQQGKTVTSAPTGSAPAGGGVLKLSQIAPEKISLTPPGIIANIKSDIGTRAANLAKTFDIPGITFPEKAMQAAGQGIGLGFDVAGRAIGAVVPDVVKQEAAKAGVALLNTDTGKDAMAAISKGLESYDAWKGLHPRAAANLEAAINIASVIPVGRVAGTAGAIGKEAVAVAKTTAKIAGKGIIKTEPVVSRVASALSGVPRETLQRAASVEYAPKIEKAIATIADNPTQPFLGVTQNIATGIRTADERATSKLVTAMEDFKIKNPGKTFDVQTKIPEFADAVKPFRSSGLIVEPSREAGKITGYQLAKTAQSPFTDKEIVNLNNLFSKIRASKAVNVDDLLALRKSFSSAYDAVPLGVNGTPTVYHAAVMALKDRAETLIHNILPDQLKAANTEFASMEKMKSAFGNRIIDSQGNLKQGAEQFISNLGNLNKGEIRRILGEHAARLGINIEDEIRIIKDAQKLSHFFTPTGSRTQDVLRTFLIGGLGFGTGGLGGAGAAALLTSPKIVGRAALGIGKIRAGMATRALENKGAVRRAFEAAGKAPTGSEIVPAGVSATKQGIIAPGATGGGKNGYFRATLQRENGRNAEKYAKNE